MSNDFYWRAWLQLLTRLETTVKIDTDFQNNKAHDQKLCDAAQRMTGVLGAYYAIYNEALECLHQNLQVQKTVYIASVIKSIVARILELKRELEKLESRNFQYLGHGLVKHHITTDDTELMELPEKFERLENVKASIKDAFRQAKEKKMLEILAEEEQKKALQELTTVNISETWDVNVDKTKTLNKDAYKFDEVKVEVEDQEALGKRRLLTMIQAHERARQVTKSINLSHMKREMWERELTGTLSPPASKEIKERSAKLIQHVFRAYFELKRKKYQDNKRDEILGLTIHEPLKDDMKNLNQEIQQSRNNMANKCDEEWIKLCEDLKQKYIKKRGADIAEDIRDELRHWFMKWFDEVKFFYDIPSESKGGSTLIVQEEVPTPSEWQDQYKEYAEKKKANKGKTALELKFEKQINQKEVPMKKREDRMKQSLQEKLMKKIMKNPKLHPGFFYPHSNKTKDILRAIKDYHSVWDELDMIGSTDVKVGSVKDMNIDKICIEAKLQVRNEVDEEMRNELKMLKKALKKDYNRNNEKMPESIIKPSRKKKLKKTIVIKIRQDVFEKMQDLIRKGVLKEYPRRTFADFLGDHNFAGDDYRYLYTAEPAHGGEMRNLWWDQARKTLLGLHRILLVGPKESGKTVLVQALASANDAVLFELEPSKISDEEELSSHLKEIVKALAACAKATQPAVIYIKHVHQLFYKKTPPELANANLDLKRRYFINKLFKRLGKKDKITVIGSCIEPWLAKGQMLNRFPEVVLIPNTNYTLIVSLLKDWVLRNHTVPRDLNVQILAQVLQGYPYGFLKRELDNYLTPDRIVRIAAFGLSLQELYDHILQNETTTKTDYKMYEEWFSKKTPCGQNQMKHISELLQYKAAADKWAEKETNRKKKLTKQTNIMEATQEEGQ